MSFSRFPKKPGNAKIRNAVKVVNEEGVKFDSRLEKFCYDTFKQFGIPFEFQVKFELQAKTTYRGECLRAITLTVDFNIPSLGVIVDTKGFQTEVNILRWKLLKARLHDQPEIFLPSSKRAVTDLAILLKSRIQ